MDILIAGVRVMYLPMLWYTLTVLGVLGLGIALYTHKVRFIPYVLLSGFPLNVAVVIIYMLFFAKF